MHLDHVAFASGKSVRGKTIGRTVEMTTNSLPSHTPKGSNASESGANDGMHGRAAQPAMTRAESEDRHIVTTYPCFAKVEGCTTEQIQG
ncbi:MAG: hypothetical protein ACKPKO_37075, partial [Candidatus Fonsibacter sp.]